MGGGGPTEEDDPMVTTAPRIQLTDEAVALATGAKLLAAATDDGSDPGFAVVRAAAIALAAKVGAELLLVDRSAASRFSDSYGSGRWTGDNASGYSHGERPLEGVELLKIGRAYLLDQVAEAKQAGVTAHCWLPHGVGSKSVAEIVTKFRVDVIVAPDAAFMAATPALRRHLRHGLDDLRLAAGPARLAVVSAGGQVKPDRS
jgi:hypothetical protein